MTHPCQHCSLPCSLGDPFCCIGCEAAYTLISETGLIFYYKNLIQQGYQGLKPDENLFQWDFSSFLESKSDGTFQITLLIDGLRCAACLWLVEKLIYLSPHVLYGRVNLSSQTLKIHFSGSKNNLDSILHPLLKTGYRVFPFTQQAQDQLQKKEAKDLLTALAITGFAMANIMLFSIATWMGIEMSIQTKNLFYFITALLSTPATLLGIRPFARSAFKALSNKTTNMDVPITVGVIVTLGLSLWQTFLPVANYEPYFEAPVSLLFFLLIGRYLDHQAKYKALYSISRNLQSHYKPVTRIKKDQTLETIPPHHIQKGDILKIYPGENIPADGIILQGHTTVDMQFMSGESLPLEKNKGDTVLAGSLNIQSSFQLHVTAMGDDTKIAAIHDLIVKAETSKTPYRALADKLSSLYTPLIHAFAIGTFICWFWMMDVLWEQALMIAISVLIITCPCALALAIPAVHVLSMSLLIREKIFIKTPLFFEKFPHIRDIFFDKTGTLTEGCLIFIENKSTFQAHHLTLAGNMALNSCHPLSKSLSRYGKCSMDVQEISNQGLQSPLGDRLGSRTFCEIDENYPIYKEGPEVFLKTASGEIAHFVFQNRLKKGALELLLDLKKQNYHLVLVSGDRKPYVDAFAQSLPFDRVYSQATPEDKFHLIHSHPRPALMIGDGMNDAAALKGALLSLSPLQGLDIAQNAADGVFLNTNLQSLQLLFHFSKFSFRLMQQNLFLTFLYNVLTIPLAMSGSVTPLLAALSMSFSSLLVIGNTLRSYRVFQKYKKKFYTMPKQL